MQQSCNRPMLDYHGLNMNFRKALPLFLLALTLLTPDASALGIGRHAHTTTLLPDGKLLVLGGVTGSNNTSLQTGEIYNNTTQAFTAIPNVIPTAKSSHTATLMGDGKVLVAGGFINGTPTGNSYIYNPTDGSWATVTDGLGTARGGHTATLITKGSYSGNVLVCGGKTAGEVVTDTCELFYNRPSGPYSDHKFHTAAPMSSERVGHTASSIAGGRVFVAGGQSNSGIYLPTYEIYDPEHDQWQTTNPLLQGRAGHTATVLNNGNILIAGGYNAANKIVEPEEAWYVKYPIAAAQQRAGSQGYLAGAEMFDSNGGRVTISLLMPYRNSQHAAVLSPDGVHHLYGGYGNIVPTFFNATPALEMGSQIDATVLTLTTATITPATSIIRFLLEQELARKINGRLVDSDIFFSKPKDPAVPSLTVDNAKIYLDRSTAPLDGYPIGATAGLDPGMFFGVVQLDPPTGTIVFEPETMNPGNVMATGGQIVFSNPTPLPAEDEEDIDNTSTLTLPVTISVSPAFEGGVLRGQATITKGTITQLPFWQITSIKSSPVSFVTPAAVLNETTGKAEATVSISFTLTNGLITNTTDVALASGRPVVGAEVSSLEVFVQYISEKVNVEDTDYKFDTSTVIVREMIFSDDLKFKPKTSAWEFGSPITEPLFNNTASVTRSEDIFLIGGRSCLVPADPPGNCIRTNKVFTANVAESTHVYKNGAPLWPDSPRLNDKRAFHTSTELPGGVILTCGGSDGISTLSSCELRDPVTKIWTYTGSMNSPRARHTATLLPNGRVLATGGAISASTQVIETSEIYYPDTGKWVPTESMGDPRANHTATLLPDGNVLVAGGNTINGYSNTAEIYYTTQAVWVASLGSSPFLMTTARAQHTATLLKTGDVLIAGGYNGNGAIKKTELYRFASQTWSDAAVADLAGIRYGHAANLLMDGRVLVTGGSDNTGPLHTAEIYNGVTWTTDNMITPPVFVPRSNHRATLLPNGKVLLTGGEVAGSPISGALNYSPDFKTWMVQSNTANRSNHTAVITSSNTVLVVGGWNGSQYLDSTQEIYFAYSPDEEGFAPRNIRNPQITDGTAYFDRNERITLLSGTTNFHGVSEASGGGSGSANSSFHNPRVYIQAVDNPSGFLTDLTTRLYTLYSGPNTDWEKSLSSITVIAPSVAGELPYGWYNMRVSANGQFSYGRNVQVTMPRPVGYATKPAPDMSAAFWRGTSSITWSWASNGSPTSLSSADGYALYAASNSVFITTVTFTSNAEFTQRNLEANTMASVLVNGYNLGGGGPLTASDTFYTLAAQPTGLVVNEAGFNSATLSWNNNGNSAQTAYQVSLSPDIDFTDPARIFTAIPFSENHTSTQAVVTQLLPNIRYYFRVQAQNGNFYPAYYYGYGGIPTAFSNSVSTLTVASIPNLSGVAVSTMAITWSWPSTAGADFYEIYDISTDTPAVLGAPTGPAYTQSLLSPNRPYKVKVRAAVNNAPYGVLRGPWADSPTIFTLADTPSPGVPSPIVPGTNTITAYWQVNGNSTGTIYSVELSLLSSFDEAYSSSMTVVGGTTVTFPDLPPNVRFYARVSAVNGDGKKTASADLGTKYTLAKPPADVTAEMSLSGVTLFWSANGNSADTVYQVRSTTQTSFSLGFSTPMPFINLYHNTWLSMIVLTDTDYLFDVEAINGDSATSGTTSVSPLPVRTVAGPNGAPPGSLGGTSSPNREVTISGTLPNNRNVSLTIPAGAFADQTAIAISSSATDSCVRGAIPLVEVAVYTQNNAQPQVPINLAINYSETEANANITQSASRLVMARYNPVSGECLPLDTIVNPGSRTITAKLNHFSIFQLVVRSAPTDLSAVRVYPNPFYTNRGQGFVTINNIPSETKVVIYTLSGSKVWEGTAGTTGMLTWDATNSSGVLVASGIYLAALDSSGGKKVIKIAVER